MTVAQQVTYVSQLLGDTSNSKWTSATHILPALNSAQEEFILKILAFAKQSKDAIGVISELQAKKTSASVTTTGYALSGLDASAPFHRNGLIAVNPTLDSVSRWCEIIKPIDLSQQQNYYKKGNDERPQAYEYNEVIYILASNGSYPITADIYYIREPKELVTATVSGYQTNTCELSRVFHRLIAEIATANCWRMTGDESSALKHDRIMQRIDVRIKSIALSGEPEKEEA